MRFLYLKEFVAPTQSNPADALAALYAARGLSTDTAVEAGYLVYLGLGMVRGLTSERRIKRALVIGPGLDLAPRTGLLEIGPPESYEPFAIIDALESLGLSTPDDLLVVGADINPRVVQHLENARRSAVPLTLVTGIGDGNGVTLDEGYRQYFEHLGARIGRQRASPLLAPVYAGHLRKAVVISPDWSRLVRGLQLDVTTM